MKNTRKRLYFTVVALLLLVTNLTALGQKKIYHPPPIHPVKSPLLKPKPADTLHINKPSSKLLIKPKPNHIHPHHPTCKENPNQSRCPKKKSPAGKGIKKI